MVSKYDKNIRTPFGHVGWNGKATAPGIIGLIAIVIVFTVIGLAMTIGAIVVLVLNIIDITHVGPNFWNILWIILSSLVLLGVVFGRQK